MTKYSQKLKDPRWQRRAAEIKSAANWKCENPLCEADTELQVHHPFYVKGWEPWDYPPSLLICLCDKCHQERQIIENDIHMQLARLLRHVPTANLKRLAWYFIGEAMKEYGSEEDAAA